MPPMAKLPTKPTSDELTDLAPSDIYAGLVIFTCVMVIIGWLANIAILKSFAFYYFYPSMPLINAVGLILLAIGLGTVRRHMGQVVWMSAIASVLLGIGNIIESTSPGSLGLSRLFFSHTGSQSSYAGGLGFLLAGAMLPLCLRVKFVRRPVFSLLMLASLLLPVAAILAFMSNAIESSRAALLAGYSLPEAISYCLFVTGLVLATDNPIKTQVFNLATVWNDKHLALYGLIGFTILGSLTATQFSVHLVLGSTVTMSLFASALLLASVAFATFQTPPAPSESEVSRATIDRDQQQKELLTFIEESGDGIIAVDNTGTVNYANQCAVDILGWSQQELQGKNLHDLIPKRFRAKHLTHIRHFFAEHPAERKYVVRGRLTAVTKQGAEKSLSISLFRRQDKPLVIATLRELNGLELDMANRMQHTHFDMITGVPDKEEFGRYCQNHWEQVARKAEKNFCINVIDIDGLKYINTKYGREFGNLILQNVATNIRSRLRSGDRLFRYTSDEFILICANIEPDAAELLAERIRTSIKVTPTKLNDNNIYVTCSVGHTHCPQLPSNLAATVDHILEELHRNEEDHKDMVIQIPARPEPS